MRLLIVNGPNLNFLGQREEQIYGNESFTSYFERMKSSSAASLEYVQSNIEGELISVVRVDASKYLDDPIIDQYLVTENPSVSLVKRGMLGADTISHYRIVVDYMNPVCSEALFEIPGFNDECDWYQAVFSTLFMIEHEGMEYQMFRGLNHNFIVKSGYDLTTYWDIFSRD